jgi:hypothetical protein
LKHNRFDEQYNILMTQDSFFLQTVMLCLRLGTNSSGISYFHDELCLREEQRWTPALFSRFRALALARAKQKKSAKARRKKSAKKSESAERERKKARILAFSSTQSGNPVSEPKAARQGESKGLE